jgi:hypothetical protein
LDAEGFGVDAATAVVIDLDKTLLGARGRNDALIDRARLRALHDSVAHLLGERFDPQAFERTYRAIDTPRFHPLTADNQDYVGYLCAIVAGGVFSLDHLQDLADAGRTDAPGLLSGVEAACDAVGWPSQEIAAFHADFAAAVAAGDPTPFKSFRRREFAETTALMGQLPEDASAEQALREAIVLTGEVWRVAEGWPARGALLFGLSDKPDEAALPTADDAARGVLPLHRIRTLVVGS